MLGRREKKLDAAVILCLLCMGCVIPLINRCRTKEIQFDGTKYFRTAVGSTYSVPALTGESLAGASSTPGAHCVAQRSCWAQLGPRKAL